MKCYFIGASCVSITVMYSRNKPYKLFGTTWENCRLINVAYFLNCPKNDRQDCIINERICLQRVISAWLANETCMPSFIISSRLSVISQHRNIVHLRRYFLHYFRGQGNTWWLIERRSYLRARNIRFTSATVKRWQLMGHKQKYLFYSQ